ETWHETISSVPSFGHSPNASCYEDLKRRHLHMFLASRKVIRSLVAVPQLVLMCLAALNAQQAKKPFTVADDIGLTLFHNPNGDSMESVVFSPDGIYFAVYSQRGRL